MVHKLATMQALSLAAAPTPQPTQPKKTKKTRTSALAAPIDTLFGQFMPGARVAGAGVEGKGVVVGEVKEGKAEAKSDDDGTDDDDDDDDDDVKAAGHVPLSFPPLLLYLPPCHPLPPPLLRLHLLVLPHMSSPPCANLARSLCGAAR